MIGVGATILATGPWAVCALAAAPFVDVASRATPAPAEA